MFDVRGGLGNKRGIPNTIKTDFEDFFQGNINKFGCSLFHSSKDRNSKNVANQMGQLMAKFEAMATNMGIS